MRIAIVIPTLNEGASIKDTLSSLQTWRQRGHQIILVDGGSSDATLSNAEHFVDLSLQSPKGRALQMNMGAEHADADVLLFLHADTRLKQGSDQLIIDSMSKDKLWGRFNVSFSSDRLIFKVIAYFMNLRSCITSIATGDQAIFVEKQLFDQVGRFPAQPLMEDVQLSILLKGHCRALCLKETVITSSRRWQQQGVVKTILQMWLLRSAYFIGVPAERLKHWYKDNTG